MSSAKMGAILSRGDDLNNGNMAAILSKGDEFNNGNSSQNQKVAFSG